MGKVLYIIANARPAEISRTNRIADKFIEAYKKLHPEDEVITLDLYKEKIDFLPKGNLDELRITEPDEGRNHPILKYAYQFRDADKYVIAEPMWNLNIPAILKAYIDYITITGITFKYTDKGPVGLCQDRKAINITTRGGAYTNGPGADFEMGDRYLRILFGFLGIRDFTTIAAEGLDVIGNDVEAIVEEAIIEAEEKAKSF